MHYVVQVMPRAARQLAKAIARWREHRANALLELELRSVIESLATLPERGLGVPPARDPERRRLLTKTTKYVVIYQVRPRLCRVEVLGILDARRRR